MHEQEIVGVLRLKPPAPVRHQRRFPRSRRPHDHQRIVVDLPIGDPSEVFVNGVEVLLSADVDAFTDVGESFVSFALLFDVSELRARREVLVDALH